MTVSVIIPALNEAETVGRSIAAAQEAGAAEVIVVDGGSSDDTAEVARRHGCVVCRSQLGRARQMNAGAGAARGDVLMFQHADNWLGAGSIHQVRAAMENTGVVYGAFRQQIAAAGFLFRALEWGNAHRVRWRGLVYGDQNLFVRRDAFFEAGGFPDVSLMEDLLLSKKLRRLARPVLLPGPLHVSPRRWQRTGVVRQTLTNWSLLTAHTLGAPPDRLAKFYPRHDAT